MSRFSRLLSLGVALAALTVPAGALGQDASAPTLTDGTGFTVGFSQANNGDVWRINQTNNVADNCKALMPKVEVIVTDGGGDDTKQSADVDDLVARGVSALLLTPNTADLLTPAAQRALDATIPVITLDRAVTIPVTQHIGADNKLIGQAAAKFVAETLLGGQGGTVLEIQGTLGASATTDRHDEFVNWLAANAPNVTIVGGSNTGNYRREDALVVMNDYLSAFAVGQAQVVYAHNDEMALGALQAIETAGRQAEIKIVGVDGQNEAIQAIADGKIAATFTYDNAGKEACETAQMLLSGVTVEPTWVLQTNQIDATNAADWIGKGF